MKVKSDCRFPATAERFPLSVGLVVHDMKFLVPSSTV